VLSILVGYRLFPEQGDQSFSPQRPRTGLGSIPLQ
jgi:hypothetical protein